MSTPNRPPEAAISVGVRQVALSTIHAFVREQRELEARGETLASDDPVEYQEPGMLTGGHFSVVRSMVAEGGDREYRSRVMAPLPGQVRTWLQAHVFGQADAEPKVPLSYETWQVEPIPHQAA